MQLFIGADHRGYNLKNTLRKWLEDKGHEVSDVGAETLDKDDDYPDYGIKVAQAVAEDPSQRLGIVICGSGAGIAVAANKVQGIRASLIHNTMIAEAARRDDNINVLAIGADFITEEEAKEVLNVWLTTMYENEERHQRRIDQIAQFEQRA